jgi:hypothetical protein
MLRRYLHHGSLSVANGWGLGILLEGVREVYNLRTQLNAPEWNLVDHSYGRNFQSP